MSKKTDVEERRGRRDRLTSKEEQRYLALQQEMVAADSSLTQAVEELQAAQLEFQTLDEKFLSSAEVVASYHFSTVLGRSPPAQAHLAAYFLQNQPLSHLEIRLLVQSHHPNLYVPSATPLQDLSHLPLENTDPLLNCNPSAIPPYKIQELPP
ncbi:hypothetical protein M5K25_020535 [Dendrobium thyrsiflorum]|uniref:Uncharacterized protein n=1 Tax=Dendrobium thyrsiflorum TaxID=117978 RepID=A0ABD0UA68_DENTH